ncbi:hypothetical protein V496_00097 [Pseudogymnoascus sp. VKM F-4515 (FW-2607)]|nr:hypothetical protein V496_00097 [Pseudogymnoascus sp. VKM F-4515 (FW-2607)]
MFLFPTSLRLAGHSKADSQYYGALPKDTNLADVFGQRCLSSPLSTLQPRQTYRSRSSLYSAQAATRREVSAFSVLSHSKKRGDLKAAGPSTGPLAAPGGGEVITSSTKAAKIDIPDPTEPSWIAGTDDSNTVAAWGSPESWT